MKGREGEAKKGENVQVEALLVGVKNESSDSVRRIKTIEQFCESAWPACFCIQPITA